MKKLVLLLAVFGGLSAQAALPPSFANLKKIDTIVAALAEGNSSGLVRTQVEDVNLHSLRITTNSKGIETASVDVGNLICPVKLTTNKLPPGMVGAASYTAQVGRCKRYMSVVQVSTMKFDEVRKLLVAYAQKNISASMNFTVKGFGSSLALEISK